MAAGYFDHFKLVLACCFLPVLLAEASLQMFSRLDALGVPAVQRIGG